MVAAEALNWRNGIEDRLERLKQVFETRPDAFTRTESLQLITLRAEFHDLLGQEGAAIEVITQFVAPGTSGLMERLVNIPGRAETEDPEERIRFIRQAIWLHLEYAWVCMYRTGQFELAIRYLKDIRAFIEEELMPYRPSHGTQARYYYYLAHCYRSLRKFSDAHRCFLESQNHAQKRYLLKCSEGGDREAERRFVVVCTARILGAGLAWNGLHTGQLSHAEAMSLSALTLLKGSGQQPFISLIETNRLIARRRASGPTDTEALDGLLKLANEYRSNGAILGQLRCGLEYVRGLLDYVTYWTDERDEGQVREISSWLKRLEAVAAGSKDATWGQRIQLLVFRYELLTAEASSMPTLLEECQRFGSLTIGTPLWPEQQILLGLIAARIGNTDQAITVIGDAASLAKRLNDPIIEAEGHLQLAHILSGRDDYVSAREELAEWERMAAAVENSYLRQFAATIESDLKAKVAPFVIRVDDDLSWDRWERELKLWLGRAAMHRAQKQRLSMTGVVFSEILGINPSTWSRWPKRKS